MLYTTIYQPHVHCTFIENPKLKNKNDFRLTKQ